MSSGVVSTKNFTEDELSCSHCGEPNPNPLFSVLMDKVQELRDWYGKPMTTTSGYRCENHPIEKRKIDNGKKAGQHTIASIDFQVPPEDCHKVVKKAFEMGFTGVGINLKGPSKNRFIHLDIRNTPALWSY